MEITVIFDTFCKLGQLTIDKIYSNLLNHIEDLFRFSTSTTWGPDLSEKCDTLQQGDIVHIFPSSVGELLESCRCQGDVSLQQTQSPECLHPRYTHIRTLRAGNNKAYYCKIIFIRWTFNFVGRTIYNLRSQRITFYL